MKLILHPLILSFLLCLNAVAQEEMKPSHPDYQQFKLEGKLPQQMPGFYKVKTTPQGKKVEQLSSPVNFQSIQKSAAPRGGAGADNESCNCFQERDETYQVVEMSGGTAPLFRNDDGSSDEIQLPFEYCLYGDTYDRVFINNNGNISFGETVGTFSSEAFPNNFVMVAPFWGDVDTRGPNSGVVYYKISEHYLVVIWEEVGYFNAMDNLRNSFQVIITDGTDPIVPFGFNTGFCYGDMQWTTGSASDGDGGFGGIPATVGANRGNSIDFVQFGRFDQAGTTYDGPFDNNDGVSWLDDKTFFFNTCTQGGQENVAPIPIASDICDTINLCVGETYPFLLNFLAVEPLQTCSTFVPSVDDIEGLDIINNEIGNVNILSGTFTATEDNVGITEVTFICVDDGTPAASTEITAYFRVLPNSFTADILGLTAICDGESTTLFVGGGEFDEYSWSPNGEATSSIEVTAPGEYSVSVIVGNCIGQSEPILVVEQPSPNPIISGASAICGDNLATIYTTEQFASYSWSNFASTDTTQVDAGTYTVTVVNEVGCEGTSAPFEVIELDEIVPVISGNNFVCFDIPTQLETTESYSSYVWSNSDTTNTTIVNEGTYTVFVEDEFGCSGTSEPFTVVQNTPLAEIIDSVAFCRGDTISLTAGGNFVSYEWRDVDFNLLSEEQTLEIWQGDTLNLTVTDEDGCFTTQQFVIPATELPTASYTFNPEETVILLPDATIQYNDNANATAGDPLAIWNYFFEPQDGTWIPGEENFSTFEQNPLITYPDTGLYFITQTVTSELGCVDTVKTSIYVIDNPYVPNAISPNGDGVNDFLKIPFLNGYPGNMVVIFNRWGKKVYEATDYKNDWDGENLPSGTYFYVVTAPTLNQELKGAITIFKD